MSIKTSSTSSSCNGRQLIVHSGQRSVPGGQIPRRRLNETVYFPFFCLRALRWQALTTKTRCRWRQLDSFVLTLILRQPEGCFISNIQKISKTWLYSTTIQIFKQVCDGSCDKVLSWFPVFGSIFA